MAKHYPISTFLIAAFVGFGAISQPLRAAEPTATEDTIKVLIPAFISKPAPLGLSVATVLNLQLWQTLRKSSVNKKTGKVTSYGNGQILWDKKPLEVANHDSAARRAEQVGNAQMVLWGEAFQYGEGYVALAYLTLPNLKDSRKNHFESWKINLAAFGKRLVVDADVPSRRYAFEPITLSDEVVKRYSEPNSLAIYSTPQGKKLIGIVSPDGFVARKQDDSAVLVTSNGVNGWVLLPQLSSAHSEVVDFAGAIVRIFRGDWEGANQLLYRVAYKSHAPTQLRVDAHLYMALANYHLGNDFQEDLFAAEKLNPYASRVVRFRVMGMIAKALKNPKAALEAQNYLRRHTYLFPPNDQWLKESTLAINVLTEKLKR